MTNLNNSIAWELGISSLEKAGDSFAFVWDQVSSSGVTLNAGYSLEFNSVHLARHVGQAANDMTYDISDTADNTTKTFTTSRQGITGTIPNLELGLSDNPLASAWSTAGASLGLITPQHHDSATTTHSGVAPGAVIVRNDPSQDLSGPKRNQTHLDGNGVANSFDPNKIARRQETGQIAAQIGMRAAGDLAGEMYRHAAAHGDADGMKAWSDGGTYKTLLHGLVGAGASALGGGNALQGAAGAAAGEAASQAMQNYLVHQGIDPHSPNGRTLMQLGSVALGAAAGSGSGAAAGLAGERYNRQLHPAYVEELNRQAKAFAAQEGISEAEARQRLIVQAYREQDAGYDAGLKGQGRPEDQAALAFMNGKAFGYFDPITGKALTLSGASEAERQNVSLYANDLYNAPQARHWVEQATGLSGGVLADWARQDYAGREWPEYETNLERWQEAKTEALVRQTEIDFLKFYGEVAITGATAGMLSGALLVGEGAVSGGSLLSRLLVGKTGAGLTAGAVNVVSQEVQKSGSEQTIHWADAGIAAGSGALGVGGGLGWNAAVGALGGYWQAQLDNKIYKENVDPFLNSAISGISGSIGYISGFRATNWLNGQTSNAFKPIIIGNALSSGVSEVSGAVLNKATDNNDDAKNHHD